MKKIIITALSVLFLAACAKNSEMSEVSGPDTAPVTYAAGDVFNVGKFQGIGPNICLDFQNRMALINYKGYLEIYDPNTLDWVYLNNCTDYWNTDYVYKRLDDATPHDIICCFPRSFCADTQNDYYYITSENQLLKYTWTETDIWAERKFTDLTALFPANSVFLSLAAVDNGNVFVAVGDKLNGEYGDTFPSHKVYRIGVTGKPVEVAVVDAPVSAVLSPNFGFGDNFKLYQYNNIILKSNGAFLYGLSSNGQIYKTGTMNGVVEYFTPRVKVDCLATALTKNNPYAVSGNQIIELRLSMAKDVVVGTIPDSVISSPTIIRANSDASVFFINSLYEISEYDYKYNNWYKLSL